MNPASSPLWKRLARAWLPPALTAWVDRRREAGGYTGDHATWDDALREAGGYDAPLILERVTAAARQARDGQVAFERDSVTFAEPAGQWPLLAALLAARVRRSGRLDLVDFGGSLGSLYFQHRAWLAEPTPVRWRVVEQPHFVAIGQREFTVGGLSFHASLDDACADGRPDGIVLSSVLPYLEKPHDLLAEISRRGFGFVVLDRTGFVPHGRDRLTVQRVPERIYPASYPCWFLDRIRLLTALGADYELKAEWSNEDRANLEAEYRGMYLERRA